MLKVNDEPRSPLTVVMCDSSVMFHLQIVLFLAGLLAITDGCPIGFIQHGQSCYHFSHDLEDWTGAVVACQLLGSHLVEISSAAEDHYITSQMSILKGGNYWIGLSDMREEGTWEWMWSHDVITSESYVNPSFSPDNYEGNENCVMIYSDQQTWNDFKCNANNLRYVCETESSTDPVVG